MLALYKLKSKWMTMSFTTSANIIILLSASVAEDRFNMWTQDGSATSRIPRRSIPKHLPWVYTEVLGIPHTALVEFMLSEQMKMSVCLFFFMQRLFAFARWLRRIHINARLLPNLFSTNVIIWFTRPFPPPFKLVWKFIHHTVDCFVAVHSNFYLAERMA